MKTTVTIEEVDPQGLTVTYRTKDNRKHMRAVTDKRLLAGIRPGDRVEVTMTRERAVSIERDALTPVAWPLRSASLDRFRQAQENPTAGFESALQEIRSGGKRGHWIWYVFPQLAGPRLVAHVAGLRYCRRGGGRGVPS